MSPRALKGHGLEGLVRARGVVRGWAAFPPEATLADLVAHFDGDGQPYEDYGQENGGRYWYARDFVGMLGYTDFEPFEKAVNRAIRACTTLGIPLVETIAPIEREIEGRRQRDYKLSRFGCYLVAVNADVKKPQVAKAQAYFYTLAQAFRQYLQQAESVDRLLIRGDVAEREHTLSGVVNAAGVEVFAFFQSAGYRGMYNMSLKRLRDMKGIPQNRSPLDFMGREELAANLFRITQTEAKIKNEGLRGQQPLEQAAFDVGRKVRKTMQELSGTLPENLPPSADIKVVRKGLKETHKGFKRLDKPDKAKRLPRGKG
jgi:DNA-damage-inducible protein D